jgi:protein phosphatase
MDAVQLAHRRVLAAGREDENLAAMGTTLTAVLIRKNTLTAAHIGDSALYLFRQQNIVKLTQDHTLAEKMLAEGTVDAADAICNAYRHVLTRALGIDMALQADMLQERLFAGDVLLICSDGLTGMVTEEAIRQALVEHPDLPDAATALIDSALEHGGLDNVTVVLVKIE